MSKMFKKLFSSTTIRTILAWAIKLGTLGFNLSASVGVVQQVLDNIGDTPPWLEALLIGSAVVVIDTVFLAAWYELDSNRSQDDADKLADAITVVIMYVITIAIGLIHGEGLAGLLFRVPMGIAVGRSTWKTISYSMKRSADKGDKASMPLRVRWENMKALTARGVALIQYELHNYLEDLKAQSLVIAEHRNAKREAGIGVVEDMRDIYRQQAINSAQANNLLPTPVVVPSTQISISSAVPTNSSTTPDITKKYSINFDGTDWVATCSFPGCGHEVKNESKDSARRKIVGHGNKHKNWDTAVPIEEGIIEEQPVTYDDSYAMYTDVGPQVMWECAICKDVSGLYDTHEDAQEGYREHVMEKKHLSNDVSVKTAFTPSDELTFSK